MVIANQCFTKNLYTICLRSTCWKKFIFQILEQYNFIESDKDYFICHLRALVNFMKNHELSIVFRASADTFTDLIQIHADTRSI